ncbi:hypothetical protein Q8A67_025690 [Cirrhinus molitorella]|uniref:Uncharacterized protein n=1 Tax=Cirrhinus molitorella TaxID=172907 RepID=A0AA88P8W1_9TELE|nr:hypothetical protein Q8A67_025690 [Cirrhinus molitorella]
MDSEEEFLSSSEDEMLDDERLDLKERFDLKEVTVCIECENDSDQIPVAKKAKTISWKAETHVDQVPQTLRFLPAQEPGPQLSPADAHSPMSIFKMFFTENAVSNLCHNTNAQAAKAIAKGRNSAV